MAQNTTILGIVNHKSSYSLLSLSFLIMFMKNWSKQKLAH